MQGPNTVFVPYDCVEPFIELLLTAHDKVVKVSAEPHAAYYTFDSHGYTMLALGIVRAIMLRSWREHQQDSDQVDVGGCPVCGM